MSHFTLIAEVSLNKADVNDFVSAFSFASYSAKIPRIPTELCCV